MDYRFSFQRPMRRSSFGSMKGTIVDLVPAGQGGRRADGKIGRHLLKINVCHNRPVRPLPSANGWINSNS